MRVTKKKFLIVWIFGMISGFTLMISGYTLNYRLSAEQIDIRMIGIFALICLPYAINFIWAPIFDTKKIPVLSNIFGLRLAWVILIEILLSIAVYLVSIFSPLDELFAIAIASLGVSFLSSAQDCVLGAMRTELVDKERQGEISGIYIFGYRIGMLISSSGAIYISEFLSWNSIYEIFSLIIITFPLLLILLLKDEDVYIFGIYKPFPIPLKSDNYLLNLWKFIVNILKPLGPGRYIFPIILFLILYRLPDNFISMMITPFLHHIGYGATEIATAGKLLGAVSAMIGGLAAGYVMKRKSIYYSLFIFGLMHAITHMLYIVQYIYGKNIYILFVITGFEGTTGGMAMAAYIAYIASLCSGKFRATQYAFFSSMMGLSRSIFPSISGYIVAGFNWSIFFIFTAVATIPALVMILYLQKIKVKNT